MSGALFIETISPSFTLHTLSKCYPQGSIDIKPELMHFLVHAGDNTFRSRYGLLSHCSLLLGSFTGTSGDYWKIMVKYCGAIRHLVDIEYLKPRIGPAGSVLWRKSVHPPKKMLQPFLTNFKRNGPLSPPICCYRCRAGFWHRVVHFGVL